MYIIINQTTYTKFKNLSYAPQVDLTNNNLPINGFTVDIISDDEILYYNAELYDDLGNLFASYPIWKKEHIAANVTRIYARSELQMLDGVTLPEIMYDGDALVDIMDAVMVSSVGAGLVTTIDYTLDSTLEAVTLTGYCPEQTARERLQWICNAVGAYVKTFFNTEPEILPIDDTATLIPLNKTFMRPAVNIGDYVSAVRVTAYTFTEGQQTESEILGDNTSYPFPLPWIATETAYEVANSVAGDSDNPVEIDGNYLVNTSNASALLARLADRYFKRETITLDVINNAEYLPGERVTVYADRELMYTGYIDSAAFKFGKQTRSTLTLKGVEAVESAALTISYTWEGMTVALETHTLPVGHAYSISTRYIDTEINGHRYVLRPTQSAVTGTLTSEGAAATVTCETALDYHEGVLGVYDVDALSVDANGVVSIT